MGSYKCSWFELKDLVSERTYNSCTEDDLWNTLDEKMLKVLDRIKELACSKLNKDVKVKVNDWKDGGSYHQSGLRREWGSPTSHHRAGGAFDLKVEGMSVLEVHELINENAAELYALGLRRVEAAAATMPKDKSHWTHIDGKEWPGQKVGTIVFFNA